MATATALALSAFLRVSIGAPAQTVWGAPPVPFEDELDSSAGPVRVKAGGLSDWLGWTSQSDAFEQPGR